MSYADSVNDQSTKIKNKAFASPERGLLKRFYVKLPRRAGTAEGR